MIGESVEGLAILAREARPAFKLAGGIKDCRRFVLEVTDGNTDFRRCCCSDNGDRRKLKSDVVTELILELRRSEAVCVELRRSGDVELERRLLCKMFAGTVRGVFSCLPRDRSSILAQFERKGIFEMSPFSMRSKPLCFRVGLGLGLMGRGNAPGGNTAGSICRSVMERLKRGIAVRYRSVIKGRVSQLFIFDSFACLANVGSVEGRRNFDLDPAEWDDGVISCDDDSDSRCCNMPR